jgi:hypothetical protein
MGWFYIFGKKIPSPKSALAFEQEVGKQEQENVNVFPRERERER